MTESGKSRYGAGEAVDDRTRDRLLPDWAEAWHDGTCGTCGGRLVTVLCIQSETHVACSVSGWGIERPCDGGKEAARQEAWDDLAAEQRMEGR